MSVHCACVAVRAHDTTLRVRHWHRVGRRVNTTRAFIEEGPTETPLAFDVVMFREKGGDETGKDNLDEAGTSSPDLRWSLGAVVSVDEVNGECILTPLYQEHETNVWLESHTRPSQSVNLSDLKIIVPSDFAQRMSPDRVSNPHGEHAEDFWELLVDEEHGTILENVKRQDE